MKSDNLGSGEVSLWASGAQALFSLVAALGSWGLALIFALGGVSDLFNPSSPAGDPSPSILLAAGTALGGFLLLPSAGYALLRLFGRTLVLPAWLNWLLRPSILVLLFPPALFLGYLVSRVPRLSWVLLPPFHLLVVGLPILWLSYIARRSLPLGSPQRAWGAFGSGMVLAPALVTVLEMLAILGLALLGIFYVVANPNLVDELNALAFRMQVGADDPEEIARLLSPYLSSPGVILMIAAFFSVIVPLLEEAVKPVGVWLLAGRNLTPAEGFVAGILSGAGFALYENLAFTTLGLSIWLEAVLLRIGAAVLHIGTTAFLGWALARAWSRKQYAGLGITYAGAVLFHGLWNALALLSATGELVDFGFTMAVPLESIGLAAMLGLPTLALAMLVALLVANARLRRGNGQTPTGDAPQA